MDDGSNHHYNASEDQTADISRTGTLWTAVANILTALIGAVLVVPWGVAQLGWIVGPVAIIIFSSISLYSALLLVDCYRSPDPVSGPIRNCCYKDAVQVNLGERKARFCALVQYVVFYGVCVAFTVGAAISVRAIRQSNCYHKRGHESLCHFPQHTYMILYGVIQVILSQIPNFHKLWALSIVAATMSSAYATLGFALGVSKVIENGKIYGTPGGITTTTSFTRAQKVWLILQALGNIALAFTYTPLVLEIQDTLKSPPPENRTMRKAHWLSMMIVTAFFMLCGCLGFAAFGENAPGNLLAGFGFYEPYWLIDFANACVVLNTVVAYQEFCQPIFAFIEGWISHKWPSNKLIMLGLLGAVNFWPLVVYFPVEMHIVRNKIPRWTLKWSLLQTLSFMSFLVTVVTAAGSIEGLVKYKAT